MASSLQTALESLQRNDYVALAAVTCIAYDYVLTFPREIEYIWNRPWTWVSTLFGHVRYVGLIAFMIFNLSGSSFIPGPVKVRWALQTTMDWALLWFICAADAAMILRVWAMYNHSRIILGILLSFYAGEVIASIVSTIVSSIPKNSPVIVSQVQGQSFCAQPSYSATLVNVSSFSQLIHAGVMCVLVAIQFTRQSVQMYKLRKEWRLNRIMNLLVTQGGLYFFFILLWDLMNVLSALGELPSGGWPAIAVPLIMGIPLPMLAPRFILDMRELCARRVQRGEGTGIDSGFGLHGSSVHAASRSAIAFADVGPNGALEDDEEINQWPWTG